MLLCENMELTLVSFHPGLFTHFYFSLASPGPVFSASVSTNLPVMIWIYGGAFIWGGGQGANFLKNYLYDGEEIATRGKVIVVTLNYRLGPLGFLSTGDENLPGEAPWGLCLSPPFL